MILSNYFDNLVLSIVLLNGFKLYVQYRQTRMDKNYFAFVKLFIHCVYHVCCTYFHMVRILWNNITFNHTLFRLISVILINQLIFLIMDIVLDIIQHVVYFGYSNSSAFEYVVKNIKTKFIYSFKLIVHYSIISFIFSQHEYYVHLLIVVYRILYFVLLEYFRINENMKLLFSSQIDFIEYDNILQFANHYNFPVNNIYLKSKKYTKCNGRIVDTINNPKIILSKSFRSKSKELTCVFLHELGHWMLNHRYYTLITAIFFDLFYYGLYLNVIDDAALYQDFGFDENKDISMGLKIIILHELFHCVHSILFYLKMIISKRHEYQADAFVCKNKYGEIFAEYLEKENIQDEKDFLYELLNDTHPSQDNRIKEIKNYIIDRIEIIN